MTDRLELFPWSDLSDAARNAVLSLSVSEAQIEYAGTVERAVRTCIEGAAGEVIGLALLESSTVVGFLVLKRGASAPGWAMAGDAVISALRIDQSRQGQGLGSRALRLVIDLTTRHWHECSRLVLSVDEDNLGGRRAYEKAGFVDAGVREQGRIGWVRYMAVSLNP